ncbi:hypothetical protein Tco_0574350 [Tanacetum coccineum]
MNWREVNPTHADYNGSRTSKRHRRSKLEYKFQDQENSEDIFSFGSTLEDFIYVVFVLVRNIVMRIDEKRLNLLKCTSMIHLNSYPNSNKNPDSGTAVEYQKKSLASLDISVLDKPHFKLENMLRRFIHESNLDDPGRVFILFNGPHATRDVTTSDLTLPLSLPHAHTQASKTSNWHQRFKKSRKLKTYKDKTLRGSGCESFWEEGDDFGVDVLLFYTCLTDILGFLKKLELWFEQDIDDEEEEEDEEGEGDSEV